MYGGSSVISMLQSFAPGGWECDVLVQENADDPQFLPWAVEVEVIQQPQEGQGWQWALFRLKCNA